jgi:hypothetical protein
LRSQKLITMTPKIQYSADTKYSASVAWYMIGAQVLTVSCADNFFVGRAKVQNSDTYWKQ